MKWEVVKVSNTERPRGRQSAPYASVGFSRISLNTAACALIDNHFQYKYAELLKGRQKNKLCIGVRFLREEEKTPNAIPFKMRLRNGAPSGGYSINGKKIAEELFGPAASASKVIKYSVAKDEEESNILIIFAE